MIALKDVARTAEWYCRLLGCERDAAYGRSRELGATILAEPHENAEDHVREFSLRDPQGYAIAIIEG